MGQSRRRTAAFVGLLALLLLVGGGAWILGGTPTTTPAAPEPAVTDEPETKSPASSPAAEPAPPPVTAPSKGDPEPAAVAPGPNDPAGSPPRVVVAAAADEPPPPRGDRVASGRVVDSTTSRPLANVTLEVRLFDPREIREIRTDSEGRFRVEGLSRTGSLHARVRAAGYVERRYLWSMQYDGIDDINVKLAPASRLFGTVTDPEGRPVAGARLLLDGVYGEIALDDDALQWLRRVGALKGREDAERYYEMKATIAARAVTDATGRYAIENVPVAQSLTVTALGDGFSPSEPARGVVIPPGSAGQALDLVLRPDTVLSLRIAAFGGAAAPEDPWVAVLTPMGPKSLRRSTDGTWTVGGLRGGRTWFFVEAPPWAAVHDSVEVAPGTRVEKEIVLGSGDGLSGRVVDDKKRGVAGLGIRLRRVIGGAPDMDMTSGVRTDDAGRFTVRGLEDGRYRVSVEDSETGFSMNHGVHRVPGPEPELRAPGALRFRVVPRAGEAMPAANSFEIDHAPDGDPTLHSVYWWSNVRFERETGIVEVLRTFPGKTTIAVKFPDCIEVRRTFEVPSGGSADFGDIPMTPSLVAKGRVLDPLGKPVANVELSAWYSNGVAAWAKSDLAGAFEWKDLAPGDVTMEAYDAGSLGGRFALATWKRSVGSPGTELEFAL